MSDSKDPEYSLCNAVVIGLLQSKARRLETESWHFTDLLNIVYMPPCLNVDLISVLQVDLHL